MRSAVTSEEMWNTVQLHQDHSASYFLLNVTAINLQGAVGDLQSSETFIGLDTKEWCTVINTDEKNALPECSKQHIYITEQT